MLRNLAISTLLCAGVVSVAQADVFRWVDDHGGVHYSDQWVPGSEVIKSSSPKPRGASGHVGPHDLQRSQVNGPPSQDTAAKAVKQDLAKVREQHAKKPRIGTTGHPGAAHLQGRPTSDKVEGHRSPG